jgi:signal transduction histidine kinase
MAEKQPLEGSPVTEQVARVAGVKKPFTARLRSRDSDDGLTLSDVDKRRTQLWSTSLLLVVGATVVIAVLYLGAEFLPGDLGALDQLASWVVVVLIGGLALAFLLYVVEKERYLRRLTAMLIEERVRSEALSSRLSEEKKVIERLEELDRLKSDFVATVSHELKTPLTAIIGSASTLSKRSSRLPPEQQAVFIEMIERQGQRLLRLVQDVLTSAQIESGRPRLRRELVDVRDAAEVIIDDLRHSHPDREVSLRTEPDRPHLWGDLGAIQQILANLVENALKYSDSGPVEVFVEESRQETLLVVRDQGRGISSDQLETIFDRFRQVDGSLTRDSSGVGLGLYIVKSLVDAHNGEIEVESEPQRGSAFKVHLPKRARDQDQPLLPGSQDQLATE